MARPSWVREIKHSGKPGDTIVRKAAKATSKPASKPKKEKAEVPISKPKEKTVEVPKPVATSKSTLKRPSTDL